MKKTLAVLASGLLLTTATLSGCGNQPIVTEKVYLVNTGREFDSYYIKTSEYIQATGYSIIFGDEKKIIEEKRFEIMNNEYFYQFNISAKVTKYKVMSKDLIIAFVYNNENKHYVSENYAKANNIEIR